MKFFDRETELKLLEKIEKRAEKVAQMTFVVGRRRIGKTSLLMNAYGDKALYFFVAKKNEALLCADFIEEIQQKLHKTIYGEIKSFKDVFAYVMELSEERNITLIIDEFQEFYSINSSVFSDMQNIWDRNKAESKMNLVLCGSMYSMMTRIFENSKEPLFGRATQRIHLKAFDVSILREILADHNKNYTPDDLLAFYLFTGGVAKYVELLIEAGAVTVDKMIDEIISENSLFLDEGKNVLIDEFGKDYGNYFSILSLIASGKTSRVEIESIMKMQTGGFLSRLEKDYDIVKKVRPILAKPGSRTLKYSIEDNFLRFWFRFIYKNQAAVEIENLDYVRSVVRRDYKTYSGYILEKYFVEKLSLEKEYDEIETYWERGNKNEIDIVAVDSRNKKVKFVEVKRNKDKISIPFLREKSKKLQSRFKGYEYVYEGLSMEDVI